MGGFFVTSASMHMTRVSSRFFCTFRRLTARALRSLSTRTIFAPGRCTARAQPTQPEPAHRSRMRGRPFRPANCLMAASTRSSVSGRGISTSRVTSRGTP